MGLLTLKLIKKQHSIMKKIFLSICILCGYSINMLAENEASDSTMKYRRSSIYSMMVQHDDQKFAKDICEVFNQMPVPDKYNDHNLSVKVVSVTKEKIKEDAAITSFLTTNNVASRLVGKWFERNVLTGECNMELIKERGVYNASEFDKALAQKSARGMAMLEDAGEDLIGNTFVLVNDISYIDKEKGSKALGSFLRAAILVAGAASGVNTSDLSDNVGTIAESYKGFSVKVHTYLYQLVWDENTSMDFYKNAYSATPNKEKISYFEQLRNKFSLKLIGEQESSGSTTSFMGIKLDEPLVMVRKACQRALDENVANLQKNFDQFKVKVPLTSTSPICAPIGKKEGIDQESKFEVLEIQTNDKGKRIYKRVGVIKPLPNLIWDNRYMAKEEHAQGADLGKTSFTKVSGGTFYQGMLIREIK